VRLSPEGNGDGAALSLRQGEVPPPRFYREADFVVTGERRQSVTFILH